MPTTLLRTFAPLAFGALLLIALATFSAGTASAGQYCENLKGELCISLTPDPDTNPVGADHTVTAAGTVDGDPLDSAFEVGFIVYSGPNVGQAAIASMNASGTADFTYTGSGGAGTDNILAIFCDDSLQCDNRLEDCADDFSACVATLESQCRNLFNPTGRVAAGLEFCFGPATAVKNWEDPTPTPSPTPVDVNAGGQSPVPTPVQLPASGGASGDSGTAWTLVALIGAAMMLSGGGALVLARRRVTDR